MKKYCRNNNLFPFATVFHNKSNFTNEHILHRKSITRRLKVKEC